MTTGPVKGRWSVELVEFVERLLETSGMRTFGLGEGLEPIGNLVETFITGFAGHSRIHIGVFMGLAGNRRFEVVRGRTNGLASCGIAGFLKIFEMAVRVTGFTFGGGPENGCNVVVAFNIGLLCEIEITAIGLGFAGKSTLLVLVMKSVVSVC